MKDKALLFFLWINLLKFGKSYPSRLALEVFMKDKTFLMIPGPTPVPESVLLDMAKHPIGHRSTEFSAVLKEVYADLKDVFQTQNDVFVLTSNLA